ncbi:triose-phosphate isomerase [Spiroplasma endosymbiont of Amphibalanus improvisus]|uniref:triose-phosphate isomerase n=1 Tax=Spiroplasma endosymbiont of Amphibalanus improvisus TaxID=3066327 RepID=UPI00313D7C26
MKNIIIGNWKMNKTNSETIAFIKEVDKKCKKIDVVAGIAVPALNLETAVKHTKNLLVVAQNCHFEEKGAFTGEISAEMLKEIGVHHVIIGHSERRQMFNETDETVNKKLKKLLSLSMTPILCCGEELSVFEKKQTKKFVNDQLTKALKDITEEQVQKIIIAYEPIWAIGTGKSATNEIAETTIKNIRDHLASLYNQEVADQIAIQYGGSVKPENVKGILEQPNINGALVGGASLEPQMFLGLVK